MAYVLSLMAHSPLAAPYQERRYERSWSSLGSNGTVQRHRDRQRSVGSLASTASFYPTARPSPSSRTHARSTSYSNFTDGSILSRQRTLSATTHSEEVCIDGQVEDLVAQDSTSTSNIPLAPEKKEASALGLVDEEEVDLYSETGADIGIRPEIEVTPAGVPKLPFQRWLNTLQRRRMKQHSHVRDKIGHSTAPATSNAIASPSRSVSIRHHRKPESWTSSIDFVTAVKSASVTVASFSIGTLSRSNTRKSGRSRNWRGSGGSDLRKSIDSVAPSLSSILDEAAQQRSIKRREKLEELIRTEESYVSDLKALSNAYFTLLPPLQPHAYHARSSARSNIASMIQLHDEILGELHRVIPFSDHDSTTTVVKLSPSRPTHIRWRSDDGTGAQRPRQAFSHTGWSKRRSLDARVSLQQESTALQCIPAIVSEVGRVFSENAKRFTLYEEYAVRCELMQEDVDFFQKTTSYGPEYDKAIETLSASLNPTNTKAANRRKALSIKDLLIKPIQRITRYELLFRDLCKYTPSCDDPSSHILLDGVLSQLSLICQNVNAAKNNPHCLRLLENSWVLQDRLWFQDKVPRSLLFQRLGRLSLCGALYVAYRTRSQIQGRYMVCIMYESCLVIAEAETGSRYNVMVMASLATACIEETDNDKGLQCHTAPHTWKLVFESAGKMFEVIFAACSAIEASAWRNGLSERITAKSRYLAEGQLLPIGMASPLISDLRSVGKAYGKAGGFVRRMSIRRTATVGPLSDLNQVIIKHTQAPKEENTNSSSSSLPIPRSQSVMTPSHVPTLAPMRQERMKLETVLSDVWTRDTIPYPGMGTSRPELSIRGTANDLIRKLSMASIASNFSKRSMSYTGANNFPLANSRTPKIKKPRPENHKPKRPPLIDFHNAPDAFLPEDFKLEDPRLRPSRAGLGLRTLTMTGCDRPRSPFWFAHENKAPELKRSNSVPKQVETAATCSLDVGLTESIARGDGTMSSQSDCDITTKPMMKEAGKKAKFRRLLGKVRLTDD